MATPSSPLVRPSSLLPIDDEQTNSLPTPAPNSPTTAAIRLRPQTSRRPQSHQFNTNELIDLLDRFIQDERQETDPINDENDETSSESGSDSNSDSEDNPKKKTTSNQNTKNLDQFLVLLAVSLQEYGCPTAAMETHMNAVAQGLGRPATFSFFNGYGFASWESGSSGRGRTHLFGTWSVLDVYKLQLCDELARHVASYSQSESPTISTSVSLYDLGATSTPVVSSQSWKCVFARYLGGTLYGTRLRKVVSADEKEREREQLKNRILHLASVGPSVFKQFKRNERLERKGKGKESSDIDLEALPSPSAQLSTDTLGPTTSSSDGKIPPTNSSTSAVLSDGSELKQRRNFSQFSLERLSKQFTRSRSIHSKAPNQPQQQPHKPKLKHVQIFTSIAVSDALSRLKLIRSAPPLYPSWLSIIIYGLSSAGCCAIFFGGGWYDILASWVLGCIVGGVARLCTLNESFLRISEFLSALVVAFCCRYMVVWGLPICPGSTTISSIIQIVQGTNITLSIMELASRHPGAGVSRLGYSLTVTALIGIGLEFGDALALGFSRAPKDIDLLVLSACPQGLSMNTQWMIFAPTILVFLIDLNAHPRQVFFMALVSTVAQVVWTYAYPTLQDPLSSFIASFTMGTLSNVYSHFTLSNPIVGILAGLQVLVPGTLAVRAFSSNDVTSGVSLAGSVLVIALSLGLGLFLGSVVAGGASGFFKRGKRVDRNQVLAL
ncbi:UNVERIFIED_CONTAM: hypothetical protein HDU68_008069 [Siphonaria sp. JEL0065]|nr:hypothetical protein HDU68_008069 [Siphonaria sp. JEL0065]